MVLLRNASVGQLLSENSVQNSVPALALLPLEVDEYRPKFRESFSTRWYWALISFGPGNEGPFLQLTESFPDDLHYRRFRPHALQ